MAGMGEVLIDQIAAVAGVKATEGGIDRDRDLALKVPCRRLPGLLPEF